MKKIVLSLITLAAFYSFCYSQSQVYTTSGGETIFSFAEIDYNGNEYGSIMRFSPVINLQTMVNFDFSPNIGLYTGLAFRNVGFIFDDYIDPETGDKQKKKFRTYNVGIPVGLKVGKLNKIFLYGGYDFEFPVNYKEKTFQNEKKNKFNVWFSDRVEKFQHGFIVGIQFPYGTNIKFKYYLSNFHNKDYTETKDGVEYKPYEFLNANIFYFSLNFNLLRNTKFDFAE